MITSDAPSLLNKTAVARPMPDVAPQNHNKLSSTTKEMSLASHLFFFTLSNHLILSNYSILLVLNGDDVHHFTQRLSDTQRHLTLQANVSGTQ